MHKSEIRSTFAAKNQNIIMGLLDIYSGIGMSPRPRWEHQIAMSNIHVNAYPELKSKGLQFLTEATLTNNWDDLAPDLVIFDREFNPLSIIEITRSAQLEAIINKCEMLMDRFPASEYFVYDYEQRILYAYDDEENVWISSETDIIYSCYLSKPLIDYLF